MSSHPNQSPKGNILIVDDTPNNLRLLSITLTKRGYTVRSAINGSMALTGANAEPPDLILLDIMMPGINGYQVCQKLKNNPRTADIPVIFISAIDETLDKVKAFSIGGADYITKPFQIEEVLVRVEHQITIRKLQKELQEKNLELEQSNLELLRSNQELEQFAHVVSHDLQQPLQGVMTSSELLALKYHQCLDEKGNLYIERIRNASVVMQQLIQNLLTYSRAGFNGEQMELTDCEIILGKVLTNLETDITRKDAKIQCDSLPKVMANSIQLMQLFQNLISNAIKFQFKNQSPNIRISAQRRHSQNSSNYEEWLFIIQDNGIGIKPEKFEAIFQIFCRLNRSQNYPGTGIGLSTCKKIVEYHGGRIWVESEPGIGTSFYFTLPIR